MQESATKNGLNSSFSNISDLSDVLASQSLHTRGDDRTAVLVRGTKARIERVTPYVGCAVVHLTPFERDGCPSAVIVPFDRVTRADGTGDRWRVVRSPALVRHVAHAIVACGVPPPLPRYTERLRVPAWQLAVAHAFEDRCATRVLLSDDVGLGKTVQAGFAIATIRRADPDARVLVACPAGLRDQWCGELRGLFGFDADPIDAAALRTSRLQVPAGVNPWQLSRLAVTSLDFLKQPAVWIDALEARWDLLVVDEAHHATPGSDRHAALAGLAGRAGLVLLITATPHAGDARDFEALCGLGAVDSDDDVLLIRRARADVGLATHRRVSWHRVATSPLERRLHDALLTYARQVWRTSVDAQASRLAMTLLIKRASSSHRALARTLRHRLHCLEAVSSGEIVARQCALPFDDTGEFDRSDDDALPALATPGLRDVQREIAELARLSELATVCDEAGDSKLASLVRLVARLREPAIVFTEYRDTLEAARRALSMVTTVAAMHGGCDRRERLAAVRDLTEGRARILLATDVAGEGLNLQAAARTIIHLELPWTPTTIEQRVGRVDRIGQQRAVYVRHLVWDSPLEGAVLRRLLRRADSASRAIGRSGLPDWLSVGARLLGLTAPVVPDEKPIRAPRSFVPRNDPSLADRIRAVTLLQQLALRLRSDAPHERSARPAIRVRRMPHDPWAHSVVIAYRVAARTERGQIAAQVVIAVRAEFHPDAIARASSRVLLRAAHQVTAARAVEASVDLLREPLDRYRQRTHAAFQRAQAILANTARDATDRAHDPLMQPGLFDRRALVTAARKRAMADTAAQRLTESASLEEGALAVVEPHSAEVIGALIVP